jgi:hypothetical protein
MNDLPPHIRRNDLLLTRNDPITIPHQNARTLSRGFDGDLLVPRQNAMAVESKKWWPAWRNWQTQRLDKSRSESSYQLSGASLHAMLALLA